MLAGPKAVRDLLSETGQSFPSCRRIGQSSVFDQAFRKKGLGNKWFVIFVLDNECGFARLGISVSKKRIPAAASRNLIKRLIRETFRQKFPVRKSLDIVVCAKRRISLVEKAEVRFALIQLFDAIKT